MKNLIRFNFVLSIFMMLGCFLLASVAQARTPEGKVDCRHAKYNSGSFFHKNRNKVHQHESLTWHVHGEAGTIAHFEFVEKNNCKGTSPFADQTFDVTVSDSTKPEDKDTGPVTANEPIDTCYNYKITCTDKTGKTLYIDPIIDIPH